MVPHLREPPGSAQVTRASATKHLQDTDLSSDFGRPPIALTSGVLVIMLIKRAWILNGWHPTKAAPLPHPAEGLAPDEPLAPQRIKSKRKTALHEKKNDTNNNITKASHVSNGCKQILCIIWQNMIKIIPVSPLRGQIWYIWKLRILQVFPVSLQSGLQLAVRGYCVLGSAPLLAGG